MGSRGPAPMNRMTQERRGNPGKRRRRGPRGDNAVPGGEPAPAAPPAGGASPPPGGPPTPPPPTPVPPRGRLPKDLRQEVDRLVAACRLLGIPIRPVAHEAILVFTASAIVEHLSLQRLLARQGRSQRVKTTAGGYMVRKHPLLEASSEAWRRGVTGLTKLGLTPADLERTGGHGGGAPSPPPGGAGAAAPEEPRDPDNVFNEFLPPAGAA